ncbi:hypothetical protein QLX08_006221 [Tetragonisca angustula]|uniref:Uncharacterized protein n=1 Tax=Tetragonisca angustula TaxID=166442 RepID=A0AAW0ZXE5_9HYME
MSTRVILNRFVRTSDTKQPCLSEASAKDAIARGGGNNRRTQRGRKSSVNAQQSGALYAMYNRQQPDKQRAPRNFGGTLSAGLTDS